MKFDDIRITRNTLFKIISDCKGNFHIGVNLYDSREGIYLPPLNK